MQKSYRLHHFAFIIPISSAITFIRFEKTKPKILKLFILFVLSFLLFIIHNSKTIWCVSILRIPHDCSATGIIPTCYELRVSYIPLASYGLKLPLKCFEFSFGHFIGLAHSQATPGLLNSVQVEVRLSFSLSTGNLVYFKTV